MKSFLRLILFVTLLLILAVAVLWKYRDPILERGLERFANESQKIFFNGTLDFEGVHLDRHFRLRIQKILGVWQADEQRLPIEVSNVQLIDSTLHFLLHRPVRLSFVNFRPQGSNQPGVQGEVVVMNDPDGAVEMKAEFVGLNLEEMIALNPENLQGASGRLTGDFYLRSDIQGHSTFQINLKVAEPGGTLQSHFFDILQPYLPAAQKKVLRTLSEKRTLVGYKEANLHVELSSPESINLLLHILVPDYNLNLNINMTVRVEESNAFLQLAELLGLIEIEAS